MTLFVDASAAVSALVLEPDADEILERLDHDDDRIWSAVSQWETIVAVARIKETPVAIASANVAELASRLRIRMVPIGMTEADLAVAAFERYGRGTGHPAHLNMGNCFAYACAKANDAQLLYKGDDFVHTDLA